MEVLKNKFKTVDGFIRFSENKYSDKIKYIVDEVIKNNKRIILLTGPSGSGKTTSAKRIVEELSRRGLDSVYLSMDNWFRTKSEFKVPFTEDGKPDYESPLCVNIELLNQNINDLFNNKEISLPIYDFINQKMIVTSETLKISNKTVIVLEGLHALNDFLCLNRDLVYRLLVCPKDVNYDDLRFSERDIRLFRRITRDKLHRGRSLEETLEMYPTVCRGEDLYLNPTLKDIDYHLNSFLDYELYLHKSVLGDLNQLGQLDTYFIGISQIPNGSLMEEFYKK